MSPRSSLLLILGLAACTPAIPDSGVGVGFGDYSEYVRQRDSGLVRAPVAPPVQPGFSTERIGAAIDASGSPTATQPGGQTGVQTGAIIGSTAPIDPFAADRPRGDAPAGIQTQQGEVRRSGISDENDFAAVSGRESIQSNAERIAQQRAQYQVVAPTALPQRSADSSTSIVKFALSTTHAPGTPIYKRSRFGSDPARACSRYISPDLAQEAFLAKGGPTKDREGLDPDGDGFACGWDPRPFRTALR